MDPIEELLLRAYPNPERVGCPGPKTIQALGAKALPPGDPAWEHIWKCSPCFAEFQKLRDARLSSERSSRRKHAIVWGSVAAILLISIGVAANQFFFNRSVALTAQSAQNSVAGRGVYEAAVFNFEATSNDRSASADRAQDSSSTPKVQKLPRRPVELTVYLARGSEDGEYQLELLDSLDRVLISTKGQAAIDKGLTRFTTVVDLQNFAPGEYAVRSRRLPDGGWHSSKAIVE